MIKQRDESFTTKINLLVVACMLCHFFLIWYFNFYKLTGLAWYSVATFVIDLLLVVFRKKIPILITFTFSLININIYALVFTLVTKSGAGAELFPLAMISGIFFFTHDVKTPKAYYISAAIPTILNTAYITIFWNWTPHATLPLPIFFYHFHQCLSTGAVLLMLAFLCLRIETDLRKVEFKNKKNENDLKYSANHDYLTGLINRRRLWDFLHIAQAQKETAKQDYVVSIFDIDNFKRINDTYGHDCGDVILRDCAETIIKMLPLDVKLGRWGGEEFVLLFQFYSDTAFMTIEAIRRKINSTIFHYHDENIKLSMTFGVSASTVCPNIEEVLIDADFQLMEGKNTGKNKVVISPRIQIVPKTLEE